MLVKRLGVGYLALTLLAGPALAGEEKSSPGTAAALSEQAVRPEPTEEGPSLELLEFLGDWETDNGDWIDPEEIEQIHFSE